MKKIVSLGGGHGLSMVLRTLLPCSVDQTAIVSVADDGGSSGRLRHDLDIVAPGDVRACMLALSQTDNEDKDAVITKMFNYRFDQGELDGHSLGNLILVALARELGSFEAAVAQASRLLNIRGRVLPATESSVVLCAETKNGLVRGQVEIEHTTGIKKVFLDPDDALPLAGVVEAILDADHIIYAPGSLFTSLIPVFIIPEIAHALKITDADITMIMNLVNHGPDTAGMTGDQHIEKVLEHNGRVDRVICDADSLKVSHPIEGMEIVTVTISDGSDKHDENLLRALLVDLLSL
ncbi:MAG TPA: YvcK family protein [Acidimicrobiia bacterium]|nr:YvcK family protein [Acidimicrobiia bacterium]